MCTVLNLNWSDTKNSCFDGFFFLSVLFFQCWFRTSMYGLFSTCNTLKTWFELSRVELHRNDLKGNKNELELERD